MSPKYKQPGVYIEETPKFSPKIDRLATAIPAFIGYTEKNEEDGLTLASNRLRQIVSLLEFEQYFGSGFPESLEVTIDNSEEESFVPKILVNPATSISGYSLYYHVKMFYLNGGGPCYIVSVGTFSPTPLIAVNDLRNGLHACEEQEGITLLVIPEITALASPLEVKEMNDAMLAQCAKLNYRFSVIDVPQSEASNSFQDAVKFRNDYLGNDNLKFGAAYYPILCSTLIYNRTTDDFIRIAADKRGKAGAGIYNEEGETKYSINKLIDQVDPIEPTRASSTLIFEDIDIQNHTISVAGNNFTFGGTSGILAENAAISASYFAQAVNSNAVVSALVTASTSFNAVTLTALMAGKAGNNITINYDAKGNLPGVILSGSNLSGGFESLDFELFNQIQSKLNAFTVSLYPSGTMAGIMAKMDSDRGVWKAPANVIVNAVVEPSISISNEVHESLNIDPVGGKSINAIRKFLGKGTLVWGARTLAGNDHEWRYISVRRLLMMVEESIKQATKFVAFEVNDSNTWMCVRVMCEDFLYQLWRSGALLGIKPDQAYFVHVGLGLTMTSVDIAAGRLIIEIGLAPVRPAEFIVLKFTNFIGG